MDHPTSVDPTIFAYVRTVISIIVGLSIGRLLTGVARFVQHPRKVKIYPVHLVWTIFMFLNVIYFWWWEFHLSTVQWTFILYCFVTIYASLFFFLCTMLFPDTLDEYAGYRDYFMSRRKWFFGIFIATFLFDIVDTLFKGSVYLDSLGWGYWLRIAFYVVASGIAMRVASQRFHIAYAFAALAVQAVWATQLYSTLG